MLSRRQLLVLGSGSLVAMAALRPASAITTEVIEMRGTSRGERVWFSPLGLAVAPGTRLLFVNRDPVNSHTATAYHPGNFERPRRIPEGAASWNSGFLLPGQHFEVTLLRPGVYDYYCIPHEMAGMVGRIIVGRPGQEGWQKPAEAAGDLPEAALAAFPGVAEILASGLIERKDGR